MISAFSGRLPILLLLAQQPGRRKRTASAETRKVLRWTGTLEDGTPKERSCGLRNDRPLDGLHGIVIAVRHRNGPKTFESTAAYGEYRITDTEWIYGYERSEDLRGASAADAKLNVRVTKPIPMLAWNILRDGSKVILQREKSIRWEFEGPIFTLFGPDGQVLRKYRKLS